MTIDREHRVIRLNSGQAVSFDTICEEVNAGPGDVVYLGGSLVEGQLNPIAKGMGNCYSDVDVFVIREHEAFESTEFVYVDGVRKTFFCNTLPLGLDVEVFDKKYVESLRDALISVSVKPYDRIANIFNDYLSAGESFEFINTFLCRLYSSICISGEEEYNKLRSSINFEKFLSLMISYSVVWIDNGFEDVEGNLDVNQLDTALTCIRKIVLDVMALVLMSNGYFSDREKWIFLKFRNFCLHDQTYLELFNSAVELFRGNLLHDAQCRRAIQSAMDVSKRTIENILLGDVRIW